MTFFCDIDNLLEVKLSAELMIKWLAGLGGEKVICVQFGQNSLTVDQQQSMSRLLLYKFYSTLYL